MYCCIKTILTINSGGLMNRHLIIIGGVAAGTKAAAKARREDKNLKITIYTNEEYISYSACGIPYYIENLVVSSDSLLIKSIKSFEEIDDVRIKTLHSVEKIDTEAKKVIVKNMQTNEIFEDEYSKILVATGASPIVPNIPNVHAENVFTVRNINDAIKIKQAAAKSKRAAIIGSGYIGIEMIESLNSLNIKTVLIEAQHQIFPMLDEDVALEVQKYLEVEKNTEIVLNDSAVDFEVNNKGKVVRVLTKKGKTFEVDLVILAVGVVPNTCLAKDSGIELGFKNAIKVNSRMETSLKDIYAAGDCAETYNIATKSPDWIPLGSTANKQGRVAAINICGGNEEFRGVLGTAITKVFDFNIALTGISEKVANKLGIAYITSTTKSRDKASYMPDSKRIIIKVLAEKNTEKIIGAQIIGKGDVAKRIDVIATAITAGMTIDEFGDIDLSYAPPFSMAIDPILIAVEALKKS